MSLAFISKIKILQAGKSVGQGTAPTATAGPEAIADLHNLHPGPSALYFLQPRSGLQRTWVACSLGGISPWLPGPSQAMVAAIAQSLLPSGMETSKDVPVSP